MIPPVLVRERALYGTGFLPDTEQQIYAPARGRAVPRRHLRGRARLAARRRDPRRRAAAAALRGLLAVLPPRGRRRRARHARHLPRAPVRQGRDVQLRRARALRRRARADPRDRGGDPAGARPPLPGRQHRRHRPRQLGGEEVRLRGVAPEPGPLPRADVVLEHDRLPGAAPEHPHAARASARASCTRSTAPPSRSGARSSRCSRTASARTAASRCPRLPGCRTAAAGSRPSAAPAARSADRERDRARRAGRGVSVRR